MGEFFVYSFFLGALLFLFPICVNADVYLDAHENRGWFSVSLYHRLRLFGGYAELRGEGFVFHLTKKKAVVLPYAELAATRKKVRGDEGISAVQVSSDPGNRRRAGCAEYFACVGAFGGRGNGVCTSSRAECRIILSQQDDLPQ